MCRLNSTKKLTKPLKPTVAPELKTVNLVSLVNREIFSAKVTLLAEDLQAAEISFKHIREHGGKYRGLKIIFILQKILIIFNKTQLTYF